MEPRYTPTAIALLHAITDTLTTAGYVPALCRYYGRFHARRRYINRDGYILGLHRPSGASDHLWLDYAMQDNTNFAYLIQDSDVNLPLTAAQRANIRQAMLQQYQTVLTRSGFATRTLRGSGRLLVWEAVDALSTDLATLSDADLGARFDTLLRQF